MAHTATEEVVDVKIGYSITKVLLGIASTVITLLLAIVASYLQQNITATNELTKSMNTFNTYMQTNNKDVEVLQGLAKEGKDTDTRQDAELKDVGTRVTILEAKL